MKKNNLIKALAALLILSACHSLPKLEEYPFETRPLAAVMPFAYSAKDNPEFADSIDGMTDSFMTSLLATGRVRLIERGRIQDVLKEMNLAASGVVDSGSAALIGKQLGARTMIFGSISNVSMRDVSRSIGIATKTNRYIDVEADVRMVDAETGELIASAKVINKAESAEKHAFGAKAGALVLPKELFKQALIGLSDKLAYELGKNIRPVASK